VYYLKDGSVVELQPGGAAIPSGKAPDTHALSIGLEVASVADAVGALSKRGVIASIDAGSRAQAELIDPEGTRLILIEP
jgi:hypothetical protein